MPNRFKFSIDFIVMCHQYFRHVTGVMLVELFFLFRHLKTEAPSTSFWHLFGLGQKWGMGILWVKANEALGPNALWGLYGSGQKRAVGPLWTMKSPQPSFSQVDHPGIYLGIYWAVGSLWIGQTWRSRCYL